MLMFFFFKQKAAYEMRISDWISDVCSSDLRRDAAAGGAGEQGNGERRLRDEFDAGRAIRAPPVQWPVRDAGSKGRHGRLRREAAGKLDREIAFSSRRAGGEMRREAMARIGFIGLGNMVGGQAAQCAKKGHALHAQDLPQETPE